MRLINTGTGEFTEFIGRKTPEYAILSHTWEEEEVSYQDYVGGACSHKKGYEKIRKTLELAKQNNLSYAWIDTCCIDKSSSAELTEAINSMYRWYQRSRACFVYLSDVKLDQTPLDLRGCRWFTRGWTLQELIAPGQLRMHFFDVEWNHMGSKHDLCADLFRVSGISREVLLHEEALSSVCVAKKMSWAADRETTRIEDMAYCLLGLFNVNMPLLYGEGSKAFRRLQEEIIRTNSDISIFAWKVELPYKNQRRIYPEVSAHCGILAKSPAPFRYARRFQTAFVGGFQQEFSISNNGLKTNSLFSVFGTPGGFYLLPLYCRTNEGTDLAVRLRKVGPNTFVRDRPDSLVAYMDMLLKHVPGHYYILVDQHSIDDSQPGTLFDPTDGSWAQLSVSSHRENFLRFELAPEMVVHEHLGCFDPEDGVFFVPKGVRTDCAGLVFSVCPSKNDKGLNSAQGCRFIILAFGWSTDIETTQYTVVDLNRWTEELSHMESLLAQGANTQTQLLRIMALWNIPKVSGVACPLAGSSEYIRVHLEPAYLTRRIRVGYDILQLEDIPRENRGRWTWPD